MFKKWLTVLGAVVLIVCTSRLLWGGGGGGEENPWHGASGGGGGTSTTVSSNTGTNRSASNRLTRIFIVRPAPMGGFYIVRLNLNSDAPGKAAAGTKKVGN